MAVSKFSIGEYMERMCYVSCWHSNTQRDALSQQQAVHEWEQWEQLPWKTEHLQGEWWGGGVRIYSRSPRREIHRQLTMFRQSIPMKDLADPLQQRSYHRNAGSGLSQHCRPRNSFKPLLSWQNVICKHQCEKNMKNTNLKYVCPPSNHKASTQCVCNAGPTLNRHRVSMYERCAANVLMWAYCPWERAVFLCVIRIADKSGSGQCLVSLDKYDRYSCIQDLDIIFHIRRLVTPFPFYQKKINK